jgi:hypothetical protein
MISNPTKIAYYLSIAIAVLAVIASASGLLLHGFYRDNDFVSTTRLGNDAVTLFLGVPILVAGLVYSRGGSLRARLIRCQAWGHMAISRKLDR